MLQRIHQIESLLTGALPGATAHKKMSPDGRGNTEEYIQTLLSPARVSAVMLLLFIEQNKIKMVLIKRPSYDGVHSGQISFPGGKVESTDKGFEHTALRETEEEIGVSSNQIKVLGALSRIYIPPSNFIVYPFVGFCEEKPTFTIETKEVDSLILPSIDILLDNSIVEQGVFLAGGQEGWQVKAPFYNIENQKVWGATAAILSEFKDLLIQLTIE